jgi:hypothetical protein
MFYISSIFRRSFFFNLTFSNWNNNYWNKYIARNSLIFSCNTNRFKRHKVRWGYKNDVSFFESPSKNGSRQFFVAKRFPISQFVVFSWGNSLDMILWQLLVSQRQKIKKEILNLFSSLSFGQQHAKSFE